MLSPTTGQIPKYYSPVRHSSPRSKLLALPFDLHVLGMPPAFNLSQDQTLQFKALSFKKERNPHSKLLVNLGWFLRLNCLRETKRKHPHKLSDYIVKERGDRLGQLPFYLRAAMQPGGKKVTVPAFPTGPTIIQAERRS